MNQETKRKCLALATLANTGNLKRAQFCAELRKITLLNHLLFVLDRITDAQLLRRGLNVFIHHENCTINNLLDFFPSNHSAEHQDMVGDALLQHQDFNHGYFRRFLERVMPERAKRLIFQMGLDQRHQPLLIVTFLERSYQHLDQVFAMAIVRHPLPPKQLHELIAKTEHMDAKLIFAKAAAATEYLEADVLRAFFRTIEGDARREVAFINAAHPSAGETFFVLLTETEFEPTRKACVRKLQNGAHSLATIEYWRDCAEKHERVDAIKWFDHLLLVRYKSLTAPQLLDILVNLKDSEQTKRKMITDTLSCNIDRLREIAGIEPR